MNKALKIMLGMAMSITFGASWAQVNVSPSNANILTEGRTLLKNDTRHYCYPGTAFTIHFSGKGGVSAQLKANSGYYAVSIDGGGFKKFSTHNQPDGIMEFSIADGLAQGEHTIKLMLVTEEYGRYPEFHGFKLSDSNAKILKPNTKKRLKIEFIGNSITCGYGNEASCKEDHFADSTSNFAKSFAGLTIKNLNAISMVVARSGIGIYKNYGDTITGSEWPMPRVYENALINDNKTPWDFSTWKPDVVVVGLGTNDLSEHNYNKEKFRVAYAEFIKNIRSHYPSAKIVLLNSPMLHYEQSGELMTAINNTINAMLTGQDSKIFRFDFQELQEDSQYGADWHPNAKFDADMARYFTHFIKKTVAPNFFKEKEKD